MLYIPVEVNGHKVKAFVDSGAQTTIMSPECAEKCGIYRLLDKRYAGIARGVGTAKILGRVHSAMIKIGDEHYTCSFTVMEGKDVDLLLGLDMLKKHQASIDLQKGKLIIQGNEVEFLGEADIPKNDEVYKEEPTIDGPSGKKIGAISGTVTESEPSKLSANTAPSAGQSTSAGEQQQQPQSTTGPASFPKEDIEQLTNMGFSKEEAIHALEIAGGNVEEAAGLLL
jgi:DNA damage-inducible protein 1